MPVTSNTAAPIAIHGAKRVALLTEETSPPTSEDGVPGFGLGISLVLLSVITLLVRKRKFR